MRRLADFERFFEADAVRRAAVQREDHAVRAPPAFTGTQGDGDAVRQDDSAVGEAVRADGRDAEDFGTGPDEGAAGGEGVGGGAGGGGNKDAVRVVAVEEGSVDFCVEIDHFAGLRSEQGEFVEGKQGVATFFGVSIVGGDGEHGAFFDDVGTRAEAFDEGGDVRHGTGGEEAEAAKVDAGEQDSVPGCGCCRREHGAVAAEAEDDVDLPKMGMAKVVRFEDAGCASFPGEDLEDGCFRAEGLSLPAGSKEADSTGGVHGIKYSDFACHDNDNCRLRIFPVGSGGTQVDWLLQYA